MSTISKRLIPWSRLYGLDRRQARRMRRRFAMKTVIDAWDVRHG